jgi:phosphoribosylformylglycinamidine synthase subunit PurL
MTITAESVDAPLLRAATAEDAKEHGINTEEWGVILDRLGRAPNLVELGIFSVMWSEHCSYKSSRRHLRTLPTTGRHVIQGPGENAGVVDIGDGLAAIFKMESHNHPSFIEPYQGAATGVGGILRDVFTMGARPVALVNALRFGDPSHPRTRELVCGVVAGIGGYGNCVGVPTVAGETNFHAGYNGNILVNAMAVGIAEQDKIFYARGAKPGQPIVYVGAKTGRDGIHGATMASAAFDEGSAEKRPTVQVGDPFTEKLLIEACLELMATDAIAAIQDMGAAGLTSSSVEMADKGGIGVELTLDCVPQRERAMTAYEMMLSESQERMLIILQPGKEDIARAIFDKWELDFAVIGTTTTSGRLTLIHQGITVCDIPVGPLADDAPNYDRPHTAAPLPSDVHHDAVPSPMNYAETLLAMMGGPDLSSRRWIYEQYDRHVMADTVDSSESGGDAAIVRVHGTKKAITITSDCTPRYVAAHPHRGGAQAVVEAYRNLSAVGSAPLAITDNLNFGNPERAHIMAQFVEAVAGMGEACRALDLPVVSGNVSLYNETDGVGIPPTPVIGGVGLLEDVARHATLRGAEAGDEVVVIGACKGHLGQSLYLKFMTGAEEGLPPELDYAAERTHANIVRELIRKGKAKAVHDVSDGGLAVSVAEMALASDIGVTFGAHEGDGLPDHAALFGEDQARYVLAVDAGGIAALNDMGITPRVIGYFGGSDVTILTGLEGQTRQSVSLAELRAAHEGWLPNFISG